MRGHDAITVNNQTGEGSKANRHIIQPIRASPLTFLRLPEYLERDAET